MVRLLRILLASSSLGLGHIVRDRVVAHLLSSRGHNVEVLCSEPALSYAEHWGLKIHRVSYDIESISKIYSSYYLSRSYKGFSLGFIREVNSVVNRNVKKILAEVDIGGYDVIIADESWELMKILMEGSARYRWIRKILITDLISFKPTLLAEIPSSILLNAFLRKSYRAFDLKLNVSLKHDTRYGFINIGPLPPVLQSEMLGRDDARRALKLSHDLMILFSLGGTAAGIDFLEKIARSVEIVKEKLSGYRISLIIAPGSRDNRSLVEEIVERLSLRIDIEILRDMYNLPRFVRAFDLVVSPAGLGSISLILSSGVPGIIFPLRKHFEQEENAKIAPKIWSGIRSLKDPQIDVKQLASLIMIMFKEKHGAPPDIYGNLEKAVRYIA